MQPANPDPRDRGRYFVAGEPEARRCTCPAMMTKVDRQVHRICEPAQIWVKWYCQICGRLENWTYVDSYDPETGKSVPAARWCHPRQSGDKL